MTGIFLFLALLTCTVASLETPSHHQQPSVFYAATPIAPFSNQYTIKALNRTIPQLASTLPQAFTFDLSCTYADYRTCRKVKATIPKAIEILERTLIIENTIHISFTFEEMEPHVLAFCTLGGGIAVKDDDDIIRFYPRALAKQFVSLDKDSSPDINITINPKTQWYFPCDNRPLEEKESLFLDTVLHEIVHGLGFASGWNLKIENGVRLFGRNPRTIGPPELHDIVGGKTVFLGFAELAFDRYLYETATNKPLSTRVASLNEGVDQFKGRTITEARKAMLSLPIYREHAKDVENLLTNPASVAFRLPNGDSMMLETSLYPHKPGSTLSHADYDTYVGTDDKLMIYRQNPKPMVGMTSPTYPVLGPKTTAVLEALGYKTHQNPNSQKQLKDPNEEDIKKLLRPSNVEKLDQRLPPSNVPAMAVSNLTWLLLVVAVLIGPGNVSC